MSAKLCNQMLRQIPPSVFLWRGGYNYRRFPTRVGSRLFSEGKSADSFSTAEIAGTDFCGFLCLNVVSVLIALFFPPPCSGCAIKELCLIVCGGDGEQWRVEDAVLVQVSAAAAALREPPLVFFHFILPKQSLLEAGN